MNKNENLRYSESGDTTEAKKSKGGSRKKFRSELKNKPVITYCSGRKSKTFLIQ
jgi:hypothetical protein